MGDTAVTAKKKIADWQTRKKLVQVVVQLEHHGNVTHALKKANAARGWVYRWRFKDSEFRDAFEEARGCGLEVLKDEAHRRAYEGVSQAVWYQGEMCGHVQKYSDTLLMFLVKQSDPTFREHFQIDHGNVGSRPFIFHMALHPDALAQQQATK